MKHWLTWISVALLVAVVSLAQTGCARLTKTSTTDMTERDGYYSASPETQHIPGRPTEVESP